MGVIFPGDPFDDLDPEGPPLTDQARLLLEVWEGAPCGSTGITWGSHPVWSPDTLEDGSWLFVRTDENHPTKGAPLYHWVQGDRRGMRIN